MDKIPNTLIDYVELHAKQHPDAVYARYLFSDREHVEVSYLETFERARRFAAGFTARGVLKGAVVLVLLEHHEDLMPAFLGAMWAGGIPAFLPPPNPKIHTERFYENLKTLIRTSRPGFVLCRPPVKEALRRQFRQENIVQPCCSSTT